jgi:hypothetical protein
MTSREDARRLVHKRRYGASIEGGTRPRDSGSLPLVTRENRSPSAVELQLARHRVRPPVGGR